MFRGKYTKFSEYIIFFNVLKCLAITMFLEKKCVSWLGERLFYIHINARNKYTLPPSAHANFIFFQNVSFGACFKND